MQMMKRNFDVRLPGGVAFEIALHFRCSQVRESQRNSVDFTEMSVDVLFYF